MLVVPLVKPQATFLLEALTTGFTGEGLEVRVAAHVVSETLLACEGSPANVTGVRFLSCVDSFMLLQVIFPGEALVAILAHEWTVTSVGLLKDEHSLSV